MQISKDLTDEQKEYLASITKDVEELISKSPCLHNDFADQTITITYEEGDNR